MTDADRPCPWCGRDTLARDGVDELCTTDGCEYRVDGRFRQLRSTTPD